MKTIHGNILDVTQGVILHQVNAKGVMGSGVAKALRDKYPQVYSEYRTRYLENSLELGSMNMVSVGRNPDLWVCNLVGQNTYGKTGQHTDYKAVEEGLIYLKKWMDWSYITSADVHHPMLGCGLGGGDWGIVSKIIEKHIGPNTNLWLLN